MSSSFNNSKQFSDLMKDMNKRLQVPGSPTPAPRLSSSRSPVLASKVRSSFSRSPRRDISFEDDGIHNANMSKKSLDSAEAFLATKDLSAVDRNSTAENNETKEKESTNVQLIQGHHIYDKVTLDGVSFELIPLTQAQYEARKKPSTADSYEIKVTTSYVTSPIRRRNSQPNSFVIRRNIYDFIKFDHHLHNCGVIDKPPREMPKKLQKSVFRTTGVNSEILESSRVRSFSLLPSLEEIMQSQINFCTEDSVVEIEESLRQYIDRLNRMLRLRPVLKCSKSLRWFCLDPYGRYCNPSRQAFNEPGLIQAECVHEYNAMCQNELDMKLRDQIIVTRICSTAETMWWFGKNIGGGHNSERRSMTVGYFPHDHIKILSTTVDLEKYFIRKTIGITSACGNAPQVSSIFGKNVLQLRKKLESRPNLEELKNRSLYQDRASLEQLTHRGWEYPAIVEMCTEFVRIHCIVQGVYRKSSNTRRLALLNEMFWSRKFPKSISDLIDFCENPSDNLCVASFIKQLFRDMSEPLITGTFYSSLLNEYNHRFSGTFTGSDNSRNEAYFTLFLKGLVKQMKPVNRNTLLLLVSHFRKLLEHVETTRMDAENLCRVWAPNLFPHVTKVDTDNPYNTVAPVKAQTFMLVWMIDNAVEVFELDKIPFQIMQRSYSKVNLADI